MSSCVYAAFLPMFVGFLGHPGKQSHGKGGWHQRTDSSKVSSVCNLGSRIRAGTRIDGWLILFWVCPKDPEITGHSFRNHETQKTRGSPKGRFAFTRAHSNLPNVPPPQACRAGTSRPAGKLHFVTRNWRWWVGVGRSTGALGLELASRPSEISSWTPGGHFYTTGHEAGA